MSKNNETLFLLESLRPALCVMGGEGRWGDRTVDTIYVPSTAFAFWKINPREQAEAGNGSSRY